MTKKQLEDKIHFLESEIARLHKTIQEMSKACPVQVPIPYPVYTEPYIAPTPNSSPNIPTGQEPRIGYFWPYSNVICLSGNQNSGDLLS